MEKEESHLDEDVSIRMSAYNFAQGLPRYLGEPSGPKDHAVIVRDFIQDADAIYQFLKTGTIPEKAHDDGSQLQ